MLERQIDFAGIAVAVDAKLAFGERGLGGRPHYPTEVMVRLLVLQQLYNLSDVCISLGVVLESGEQRFVGDRDGDHLASSLLLMRNAFTRGAAAASRSK